MNVKYLLIFSFFLEIQSVEEQSSQFEDIKKQFDDVKKQSEDTKLQLEDNKLQLEDTKIQFEDSKTQLENSKAEISELEKKLAKMVEYCKDPCKNCKGPTVCLDGQVLHGTPGYGTMIRPDEDTSYMFNEDEVNVDADDFGTVGTLRWGAGGPVVNWNKLGSRICDDFTGFVYKCK